MRNINDVLKELNIDDDVTYFTNPYFTDAIIGVGDNGALIYDYDSMIKCAMEEQGWSMEDAIDWIEYNTIRTIPYMGSKHPIIHYNDEE